MANLFNQQQSARPDIRQQIRQNPQAYLTQLKSNPAGFLNQFGINIPQNMTNPTQIIQYLYGNPPPGIFRKR